MNTNPKRMLEAATAVAISRLARVHFRFGTVGIRGKDGVLVASYNELAPAPERRVHAEYRLAAKLTPGSVIAVVRLSASGEWTLSKPCISCQKRLKTAGVKRVYYTIAPNEYGVMEF